MFSNLFSKNKSRSECSFFKVEGKNLIAIDKIPGNGSINSVIEYIYTVNTSASAKLECLGFETLSKKLIFVLTKNAQTKNSFSEVFKAVNEIDWDFEYSSLNVENILRNNGMESTFKINRLKA